MDMPVKALPRRACSTGKREWQSSKPKSSSLQTIRAELAGRNTCIARGIAVEANAPVLELCRALLAAGHDPGSRLEVYRGNVLCVIVRSIGEGARLEINGHGAGFRPVGGGGTASPVRQIEGGGL
jgi:hypothetical protein